MRGGVPSLLLLFLLTSSIRHHILMSRTGQTGTRGQNERCQTTNPPGAIADDGDDVRGGYVRSQAPETTAARPQGKLLPECGQRGQTTRLFGWLVCQYHKLTFPSTILYIISYISFIFLVDLKVYISLNELYEEVVEAGVPLEEWPSWISKKLHDNNQKSGSGAATSPR